MPIWFKLLTLGFGLIFLLTGLGLGVFGTRHAQAQAARAERLAPTPAAAVEAAAPGAETLVEAVVSPRNATLFRDFVAFKTEEYQGEEDANGNTAWQLIDEVKPRLILEAGGVVVVANEDYRIEGAHAEYQDPGPLVWNGFTGEGTRRYEGLVSGATVTVIGTVVPGVEGNELRAELVFAGSRAAYIAGQQQSAMILPIMGAIFGLIGALITGAGAFTFFRS